MTDNLGVGSDRQMFIRADPNGSGTVDGGQGSMPTDAPEFESTLQWNTKDSPSDWLGWITGEGAGPQPNRGIVKFAPEGVCAPSGALRFATPIASRSTLLASRNPLTGGFQSILSIASDDDGATQRVEVCRSGFEQFTMPAATILPGLPTDEPEEGITLYVDPGTGNLNAVDSDGTITQVVPSSGTGSGISPYVINFVTDCGADPTGATDCGEAWALAFTTLSTLAANNLLPIFAPGGIARGFTLYVPPGIYLFSDGTNMGPTWDFNHIASAVTIQGEPSASIFKIAMGPSKSFPAMANMYLLFWQGMTFMGANVTDNTSDADAILNVNAQYGVLFDRCQFTNMMCQVFGILSQSRTHFRDCDWINCAAKSAVHGLIYGLNPQSIVLERTNMTDAASFNGVNFGINKVASNINQIYVNGQCELVRLDNCLIDEGCNINLWVDGGSFRVRLVEIIGCEINPAVHLSSIAAFKMTNVDHLVVDGIRQATASGAGIPWFVLSNVLKTDISSFSLWANPTDPAITTASSCGSITIVDSPNLNLGELVSIAGVQHAYYEKDGIVSEYWTWNGSAIIPGQLVKIAGSHLIDPILTTDPASAVLGATLPTDSTASSATLRVVKPGQAMQVLTDGTGAIVAGDPITVSGTSGGRTKKQTVSGQPIIGRAIDNIGASPDGGYRIFFMPGVL